MRLLNTIIYYWTTIIIIIVCVQIGRNTGVEGVLSSLVKDERY